MILKKEYYVELSWWRWAQLRALLAWSRHSGGFARMLGADGKNAWQLGPIKTQHSRKVPVLNQTLDENEMRLARQICPTRAIIHDLSKGWEISSPRCIACGLCYACAPHSLSPSSETLGSFVP